jgi:hypothetical protein
VAHRAHPPRRQDRSAAIVSEDRRRHERRIEGAQRQVERGAPGHQLAAAHGRQRAGEDLLGRGERGERGIDGSIGELDDDARAVRRGQPLDDLSAEQVLLLADA